MCLAGLKNETGPSTVRHSISFYLSTIEVIQNERKVNFATLYDQNLSSKRACYVNNLGSINDSRITVTSNLHGATLTDFFLSRK